MKKITYLLILFSFTFLSSTAQQELINGNWILDYVMVDNNTYFAPPLFSTTPGCLPISYFPGIDFGIDGSGEYEAFAILTFNNWFHVSSEGPMTIDSNSFTTLGAVTLGSCDCICDLEGYFLSTILAGDFTTRTFSYTIEDINGTDILTITTPEDDIAVFYDYSLSINDNDIEQTFKLYPNPSSKDLNIYCGKHHHTNFKYSLNDGKNITSYSNPVPNSIDISNLANGVYFVEFVSTEGVKSVQRFLKK